MSLHAVTCPSDVVPYCHIGIDQVNQHEIYFIFCSKINTVTIFISVFFTFNVSTGCTCVNGTATLGVWWHILTRGLYDCAIFTSSALIAIFHCSF